MQEDYDKAAKILDTILDEDEANNQAKKRKIAMINVNEFPFKFFVFQIICLTYERYHISGSQRHRCIIGIEHRNNFSLFKIKCYTYGAQVYGRIQHDSGLVPVRSVKQGPREIVQSNYVTGTSE